MVKRDYKVLAEEDLQFTCDCSRQRFEAALMTLSKSDLKEMKEEDHGAEIVCQFCGKNTNLRKVI